MRRQLRKLWHLHSNQNETKEEEEGKVKSRDNCEQELAAAHQLWSKCENLVYDAAAWEEEDSEMAEVLAESKRLLTACDELISLKEEILRVYDFSADMYAYVRDKPMRM